MLTDQKLLAFASELRVSATSRYTDHVRKAVTALLATERPLNQLHLVHLKRSRSFVSAMFKWLPTSVPAPVAVTAGCSSWTGNWSAAASSASSNAPSNQTQLDAYMHHVSKRVRLYPNGTLQRLLPTDGANPPVFQSRSSRSAARGANATGSQDPHTEPIHGVNCELHFHPVRSCTRQAQAPSALEVPNSPRRQYAASKSRLNSPCGPRCE